MDFIRSPASDQVFLIRIDQVFMIRIDLEDHQQIDSPASPSRQSVGNVIHLIGYQNLKYDVWKFRSSNKLLTTMADGE